MNAEKSQKDTNIPADLQPYYDQQQGGGRPWVKWVTRILALVIVTVLIVLFGRWVWDKLQGEDDAKPATSSSQKSDAQADTSKPSDKSSNRNPLDLGGSSNDSQDRAASNAPKANTGGSAGTSNAAGGNSAAAAGAAGQSTTLASSGPKETLAVFVAATFCFALLYELKLRKQAL